MQIKKILAIITIIILIANTLFLALGRVSPLAFWIVIILSAGTAYIIRKL